MRLGADVLRPCHQMRCVGLLSRICSRALVEEHRSLFLGGVRIIEVQRVATDHVGVSKSLVRDRSAILNLMVGILVVGRSS